MNEDIIFTDHASKIRLQDCPKLAIHCKNDNDVTIYQHNAIVNFFKVVVFLLPSLVTGLSFKSISLLVLEVWQFSFVRDWSEIQKLEITPSEFFPISLNWCKLETPNLAQNLLMKFYWMLQHASFTAFTISEFLREKGLKFQHNVFGKQR